MPIPYFNGFRWNDLTREERFYCFVLYSHIHGNAQEFAAWLKKKIGLGLNDRTDWEAGLEVCFYRDYLWHQGKSIRGSGFSPKRTFDLCLFGQEDVVIIEAKVYQPFDSEQNETFSKDAIQIIKLLSPRTVNVWLVALASTKYFQSADNIRPFHGHLTWADMYEKFGDELLKQADELYCSRTRKLHKSIT
jgi:hypothetical protein